jgi:catechol 2,3-dioxygenase-like lactoylglutathione lyase family enzyme
MREDSKQIALAGAAEICDGTRVGGGSGARRAMRRGACAMIEQIEGLIRSYENGKLTRRTLLQGLAMIAAAAPAARVAEAAQKPAPSAMKARLLHHVNVQVSDVPRSETFYRQLLGLPASRVVQGPDNHGLDLPDDSLVILQRSDTPGKIDHFCIGVENFDANRMRTAVSAAGAGEVIGKADDNFFVKDPDGLRVQVSAVDWAA